MSSSRIKPLRARQGAGKNTSKGDSALGAGPVMTPPEPPVVPPEERAWSRACPLIASIRARVRIDCWASTLAASAERAAATKADLMMTGFKAGKAKAQRAARRARQAVEVND